MYDFFISEPSYWLLQNKQPVEIGGQMSSTNQPIGRLEKIVLFVTEKNLVHNR